MAILRLLWFYYKPSTLHKIILLPWRGAFVIFFIGFFCARRWMIYVPIIICKFLTLTFRMRHPKSDTRRSSGNTCCSILVILLLGTCIFLGLTLKGARVAHEKLWERLKLLGKQLNRSIPFKIASQMFLINNGSSISFL